MQNFFSENTAPIMTIVSYDKVLWPRDRLQVFLLIVSEFRRIDYNFYFPLNHQKNINLRETEVKLINLLKLTYY